MTAQFLQNELTNLVQEAKRKNSDLRHAAEKAVQELKSIAPTANIEAELSLRPGFLSPFLIACSTRNAKFNTIGVTCLQRLIVSKALAKSRLREVLEAFREAANLGIEIQLKILQALPPLLQNYAEALQGPLLGEALLICAILQGSKMGVVNNTAAATLSQIVISIFDKVVAEDELALEIPTAAEAPSEKGNVPVRPAASDAYRVFYDLCLLTEGQKPTFLRFNHLPQPFGLELIESVLTNHPDIFLSHPEQAHILQTRVAPLVMKSLSDKLNFPTTVRIVRVLYILLRRHLSILSAECEVALSLLTHMLEPDASQPWKRALCMEVFRGICHEPALVRKIFAQFDAREGGKPIITELMGALTRLATEKPGIIGLGTQSSAPVSQQAQKDASSEQAALEAGGVAGIIGGAVGLDITVSGLGSWSLIRVPCIDQLDKSEPPSIPESYIYYLTLICINSFSEGLAKFVLPLAVGDALKRRSKMVSAGVIMVGSDTDSGRPSTPARTPSPAKQGLKRKGTVRQPRVPVNPLTLESHPNYAEIKTASMMVDKCWPAVLAACSTFLYATLDNDLYHNLVRAFQKFAHVAGILRLMTPRDAFLTTLGKSAVPSNILSANVYSTTPVTPSSASDSVFSSAKGLLGVDTAASGLSNSAGYEHSTHSSLNVRNLLCLRALLNIGIALGPTLDKSWTIVLETLQQADYVLFASSRRSGRQLSLSGSTVRTESQKSNDSHNLMANIGPELGAVESAATKMFEVTRDFPDEGFVAMLAALCRLLDPEDDKSSQRRTSIESSRSTRGMSPTAPPAHRRMQSVSTILGSSQAIGDHAFSLAKLGELALINMSRLIGPNPDVSGWTLLVNHLVSVTGSRELENGIRFKAAEVLNEIVVAAAKAVASDNTENTGDVQWRILEALKSGIRHGHSSRSTDSATKSTELEIHHAGLEALNAILEHSGQRLVAGWEIAFDVITSVFDASMTWKEGSLVAPYSPEIDATGTARPPKSVRLIRSSFSSLELICSDFLASLPTSCVLVLIDALFAFCSQKDDLNISLTTITFFWNASDFLQSRGDPEQASKGDELTAMAKDERDLLDIVERKDVDSHAALWMLLLLRLTGLSADPRAEVRNGSIQTLFRIFDTYGHQLGPQGWSSCLEIVVFKMMNMDPKNIALASNSAGSERKQWDDTIKLVLSGIGTLYSNYFDVFSQQKTFGNTWTVFVRYLETLLSWKSFEVSTTVFIVLSRVLEKVDDPEKLSADSKEEVWVLWSSKGIKLVEGSGRTTGTGIQDTLTAYVDAFKTLYRLFEATLSVQMVQKCTDILKECILFPDAPPYFRDVDMITPLQCSVLDIMKMVRTDIPSVPSQLLMQLSEFTNIAYSTHFSSFPNATRLPTCIALSTQCMDLMEKLVIKHVSDPEIYTSSALNTVLKALEVPIGLKYTFTKRPEQFVNATRAVLAITRACLPAMDALDLSETTQRNIWRTLVTVVASVVRAAETSGIDENTLRSDEEFDMDSFRRLRDMMLPGLGRELVPTETIQSYVEAVFKASMLYNIDIPTAADDDDWMDAKKHGSTTELALERRNKMSYVCIDELFSLVAASGEDDAALQRVAEVAAPWLIRRVGMVLCCYISDQPLRGRMPQPITQRKEMLYVLREVVKLESRSETVKIHSACIPKCSKRHLFKLLPLFTQCVAVAQGDQELLGLLSQALGEIGTALEVR